MEKNIGIVGLGLIGASMAKSIKAKTSHHVFCTDVDVSVTEKALADKAIDNVLDNDNLNTCDIVILSLYPDDVISWAKENIKKLKRGMVLVDCAGVKANICKEISPLAFENGIYFVGGHPMAGIEKSGYDYSYAHLFDGASMILCKDQYTNIVAMKALELLFTDIGFMNITITIEKEHDRIIAFTSQLAHVVSSAYVKSETAQKRSGFSAGSYKDLTRVATLNEKLWTELFFSNRENLLSEVTGLISRLQEYANCLEKGDHGEMMKLLEEGKKAKEIVG